LWQNRPRPAAAIRVTLRDWVVGVAEGDVVACGALSPDLQRSALRAQRAGGFIDAIDASLVERRRHVDRRR